VNPAGQARNLDYLGVRSDKTGYAAINHRIASMAGAVTMMPCGLRFTFQ
jgi:hypothetical protein